MNANTRLGSRLRLCRTRFRIHHSSCSPPGDQRSPACTRPDPVGMSSHMRPRNKPHPADTRFRRNHSVRCWRRRSRTPDRTRPSRGDSSPRSFPWSTLGWTCSRWCTSRSGPGLKPSPRIAHRSQPCRWYTQQGRWLALRRLHTPPRRGSRPAR